MYGIIFVKTNNGKSSVFHPAVLFYADNINFSAKFS